MKLTIENYTTKAIRTVLADYYNTYTTLYMYTTLSKELMRTGVDTIGHIRFSVEHKGKEYSYMYLQDAIDKYNSFVVSMDIQKVTDLLIEHEGYCTIPGRCNECCYNNICERIHGVDMKLRRFNSAKIIKENNYDIYFFLFEEAL